MAPSIPHRITLAALAASLAIGPGQADPGADPGRAASAPAAGTRLAAAKFTASGELLRPDDLDEWVFLGAQAAAVPPGNPCVECHLRDGAFDGTFAQLYPAIRHKIPSALLHQSR